METRYIIPELLITEDANLQSSGTEISVGYVIQWYENNRDVAVTVEKNVKIVTKGVLVGKWRKVRTRRDWQEARCDYGTV